MDSMVSSMCDSGRTMLVNLRIMTMNCRSIRDKKSEFAALVNYAKPDIIIGTESWLKGIKPGKPPTESSGRTMLVVYSSKLLYVNESTFILSHLQHIHCT
jgi:hypothetical protein